MNQKSLDLNAIFYIFISKLFIKNIIHRKKNLRTNQIMLNKKKYNY